MEWTWQSDQIWTAAERDDKGATMEHVAEWQAHLYLFEHDSMTKHASCLTPAPTG